MKAKLANPPDPNNELIEMMKGLKDQMKSFEMNIKLITERIYKLEKTCNPEHSIARASFVHKDIKPIQQKKDNNIRRNMVNHMEWINSEVVLNKNVKNESDSSYQGNYDDYENKEEPNYGKKPLSNIQEESGKNYDNENEVDNKQAKEGSIDDILDDFDFDNDDK